MKQFMLAVTAMTMLVSHHVQYTSYNFGSERVINIIDAGRPKDFIFVHKNGKLFKYHNLNAYMFNVIFTLSRRIKLSMSPRHHTPHALRTAACTDVARAGCPAWQIEQQCRWSSNMWRKIFFNMDWKDFADLNDCTVSGLV